MSTFLNQREPSERQNRCFGDLVKWKNPQYSLRVPSPLWRGNDFSRVSFSVRATLTGVKAGGATALPEREKANDESHYYPRALSHSHPYPPPLRASGRTSD